MSRGETKIIYLERPGPVPWGFRLQGGRNFQTPLSIQSVSPGSVADQCGLCTGDAVLRINNLATDALDHDEAKEEIMRSDNIIEFLVERGGMKVWKPKVTPMSELRPDELNTQQFRGYEPGVIQHTSLAADKPQDYQHIGSSHNRAAKPFPGAGVTAMVDQSPTSYKEKRVVHAQFNSPMGLYSQPNVADSYRGQVKGVGNLSGDIDHDTGGAYAGSPYQPQTQAGTGPSGFRSVAAPSGPPAGARPPQQGGSMKCGMCGEMIRGVFIRIQGTIPLHPECLKCLRCGQLLKNIGYFVIDGKLYCETHAKQAAPRPEGVRHLSAQAVYR
ncbi:PDZ and LIM domain protein 3-like isoform X3 [Lineus longissimus]|uniref:PDZ and LIM domain protein 3-like isoform X3 n=1 Tax=Lineus longissimus TaxID=88925 RepID=UPI00315D0D2A